MRQYGKQTKLLSEYIAKVAQGKRAMIQGPDYVVLSRNIYDSMVDKLETVGRDNPLLDIDDAIDLQAAGDRIYDEIEERQRREYPRDK